MPAPVINAVSVTTRDMTRSVAFYEALGFDFTGVDTTTDHVEPLAAPGATRLMIDGAGLIRSITGTDPKPATHSGFALLCATPAEVDAAAAKVAAAGFSVVKQPWDAFWGQRYAILADPAGYQIDLFAPLEGAA
jgi:catechol 2,3-dioxygenase-like lactoylglutathione lyase family enzyme